MCHSAYCVIDVGCFRGTLLVYVMFVVVSHLLFVVVFHILLLLFVPCRVRLDGIQNALKNPAQYKVWSCVMCTLDCAINVQYNLYVCMYILIFRVQ